MGSTNRRRKFPPLYDQSFAEADAHGEAERYNASHNLNVECARAINEALAKHYNNSTCCLDTETASKEVVGKFGFERTMYVLACTVRHYDYDGRVSFKNKKWARTFPEFDDKCMSSYYLVTNHPGLTDMLVEQVRHDYLLTQPMKAADVRAEAERILTQFQNLREPNIPGGEHFEVRVSPVFLERAKPRHIERLMALLPFPSLQISAEGRDTYAVIDKGENRFQPLQLRKPSVKAKLAAKPIHGGHPAKPKDQGAR